MKKIRLDEIVSVRLPYKTQIQLMEIIKYKNTTISKFMRELLSKEIADYSNLKNKKV